MKDRQAKGLVKKWWGVKQDTRERPQSDLMEK